MLRLQATLIDQTGNKFSIRVLDVDSGASFTYDIDAPTADDAAFKALRIVEAAHRDSNTPMRKN